MEHTGLERIYRLIVPASYDSAAPMPLILALHGGGGDGGQMCALVGGVQELAEEHGFLVVCPDAIENHWNDGRGNERYRSQAEDIDDVGFLLALIERLRQDFNIDPTRIYVTGASNGGMMTQRMACEASETFAAAAVLIASQPVNLHCEPRRPISILFMNGTDDPLMPYQGGQVHFFRQQLGEVLSTEQTVAMWAFANGCDPASETTLLPDLDPEDGTRIQLDAYAGCTLGVRVMLYTVQGGGHTWPGGSQYLPQFVIGRVSHDLRAGQEIWGFFETAGSP
jgi:polyhydroxybutyrate depolymerase